MDWMDWMVSMWEPPGGVMNRVPCDADKPSARRLGAQSQTRNIICGFMFDWDFGQDEAVLESV